MAPDKDPSLPRRRTRLLIAVGVTAVLIGFVLLHLTGVLGPGSH